MNYLYELLDSEDLFRIPRDIKSRFAKLTLSKKKEIRKSITENPSEVGELLARNIIDELISDDSSEGEADAINRIFLSKSTKMSEEYNDKISVHSGKLDKIVIDTENKIVLNDSDVTHCSIYEKKNNSRPLEAIDSVLGMEPLKVTENIVFTNSENLFFEQNEKNGSKLAENVVDVLSQRVSKLDIKSPKKLVKHDEDTVENTQITSKENHIKSGIHSSHFNIKTEINKSILTISSTNTTPAKTPIEIQEDDDISDSGEEVIVITDTDDEHITEYENHVSDICQSGQTNLYSTLSNTRADRVEAFLHDLKKIPQVELYENNNNQREDEQKNNVSKSDQSIPSDSIEIAETSSEHDHEMSVNAVEKDAKVPYFDQESPTIEDNSPLIQTEKSSAKKQTASSNSLSDSSDCNEEISISAKINIKIQFSQPKIFLINGESFEYDKSPTTSSKTSETRSKTSSETSRQSQNFKENQKITTPKNVLTVEEIISPTVAKDDASLDDVDDKAKKILTKLYGNTWKTPEIIKKLNSPANQSLQKSSDKKNDRSKNRNVIVKTNSPVNLICAHTGDDTTLPDFSMFHKNIRCDLESTRLTNRVKSIIESKRPQTERKPRNFKNMEKKCESVKTKSGRETKRINYRQVISPDSSDENSNKCFGSSSDDDKYKTSSLSSSSSDESYKKQIINPRDKRKNKNELIYMDLSTDIVKIVDKTIAKIPEICTDSNEKLKNVLKSCTFNGKKTIQATPKNTVTKRKLFTPQFGHEDENIQYNSPVRQPLTMSEEVQLKIPLPSMFGPPVNKQLESVKTGTPIFKLPTPTKKTPKTIQNKVKSTENVPVVTIKTPSSLRRIKKALADEFLDDNPQKTYGFLQSLDVCTPKSLCCQDAVIYREKFRQTKDELTDKLFKLYNEKVFDNKLDVSIIWNKKLQNTAGRCCNRKKANIRSSTIELSEKVLTSGDRLRCTLIHELCHAATWIYSGENGHGATWKGWANKANKVLPELPAIGVCHNYDIEYKYTYKCTVCAAKSNAHSRSKKVENIRCSYCHGTIEIFLNKKNKDGVIISTPVKGATGFAKFVKEKYKLYKRPNVNHGEVMKILSAEFAGLSVEDKSKF